MPETVTPGISDSLDSKRVTALKILCAGVLELDLARVGRHQGGAVGRRGRARGIEDVREETLRGALGLEEGF